MIKFLRSMVSAMVVGISFGLLNVCQILTLPIGFLSKSRMRAVLFYLAEKCSDICVWWLVSVYKIKPNFDIDEIPAGENALLICNHQAFADVVVIMHFAALQRRVGHLKFFVKDSLKWLPGPGWSLWFYDSIFLKRHWDTDAAKIDQAFAKIRDHQLPFWLVSFPEGTRATPRKLEASVKYAQSIGIEPFKHRLCPRTKGVWATTVQLKGRIDAVYDLTINYHTSPAPNFWNFLSGKTPNYSLRVKRYPISQLPETQAAQKAWLFQRFREKDIL